MIPATALIQDNWMLNWLRILKTFYYIKQDGTEQLRYLESR